MSDGKESHSVYSSAPLSPMRSEEFDYQQSNITLLKVLSDSQPSLYQGINNCETEINGVQAQLKLVTHERDNLKKDVKRISQVWASNYPQSNQKLLTLKERDGAYRHLSLSASPQSSLETPASHHRTNSDTAPTVAKTGRCPGMLSKQNIFCKAFQTPIFFLSKTGSFMIQSLLCWFYEFIWYILQGPGPF